MSFNAIKAFSDTLQHAEDADMEMTEFDDHNSSFDHLVDMFDEIRFAGVDGEEFDEAKINRWLGYAQGVIVATGYGTVDDMKRINEACKE